MKFLAIIVGVGMAVFTAASIAFAPGWSNLVVANVGPISVSTFDLLFAAAVVLLLVANAVSIGPEREPANRLVLGLCWVYVGYQLFVVLPAAVLLHDLRPIDVVRLVEVRLFLILIPVTYSSVLRYWKPGVLIAIVDAAAAGLAVWVIYSYLTHGAQGYVESGVFRLRAVWGGGILLFGWLLLTSLFYWPLRVWRLALAALALAAIGLANHRSGVVALVASFLAVIVAMRGVSRRALIALALLLIVSFGFYLGSSSNVRTSLAYTLATSFSPSSDQTAQDRVIRSVLGMAYFEQHPLGDYVWNRRYYAVNLGWNFVPHNFVVQLLVSQGVIASGLYFAIIGATFFIAWRNRRDRLSGLMLVYLVLYLTFCLFNANIDLRENVSLFCICVAVILHQNRKLQLAQSTMSQGDDTAVTVAEDAADSASTKRTGVAGRVSSGALVLLLAGLPRRWARLLVAFGAAAAAPFLPCLRRSWSDVRYFFKYDLEWPLQIGGVLGTPQLLGQLLGAGWATWAFAFIYTESSALCGRLLAVEPDAVAVFVAGNTLLLLTFVLMLRRPWPLPKAADRRATHAAGERPPEGAWRPLPQRIGG